VIVSGTRTELPFCVSWTLGSGSPASSRLLAGARFLRAVPDGRGDNEDDDDDDDEADHDPDDDERRSSVDSDPEDDPEDEHEDRLSSSS